MVQRLLSDWTIVSGRACVLPILALAALAASPAAARPAPVTAAAPGLAAAARSVPAWRAAGIPRAASAVHGRFQFRRASHPRHSAAPRCLPVAALTGSSRIARPDRARPWLFRRRLEIPLHPAGP